MKYKMMMMSMMVVEDDGMIKIIMNMLIIIAFLEFNICTGQYWSKEKFPDNCL